MATSTHQTRFVLSAKDTTKVVLKGVQGNFKNLGKAVTGVHTQLLALAGIGGFGAVISGIVSTNAEMQTMKASLKTMTGSTVEASRAFEKLSKFAASTPYDLDQAVQGFIKLKALGLDPSTEALRSYGNTAAAMGKDLNQMIEAVADAATGEFERLKEFGIKASKQGDQVSFTFQGVTTTIKNNSAEITKYLQAIGNNQFGSAMADQMNNLGPAFSNFKMALQNLQVQIGEAGLNDAIISLTTDATKFISALDSEQVQKFTRATLGGLAGAMEGVADAYDYISGNQFLQAGGIIGYMLFGKLGVGGAILLDQATNKIGADIGQMWQEFNKSGVTGAGGFGGDFNQNPMPGYQLGDFARSNGRLGYFEKLNESRAKGDNEAAKKQDETNSILREIAERLRTQQPAAVAG